MPRLTVREWAVVRVALADLDAESDLEARKARAHATGMSLLEWERALESARRKVR